MAFFAGLVIVYFAVGFISGHFFPDTISSSTPGIIALTVMFFISGVMHFTAANKMVNMIPGKVPYKTAINYTIGLIEIILGIGLLFESTGYMAAWLLILLLVAVFPANIYAAQKKKSVYNITRLAFQPIYILWIWWFCIKGL